MCQCWKICVVDSSIIVFLGDVSVEENFELWGGPGWDFESVSEKIEK